MRKVVAMAMGVMALCGMGRVIAAEEPGLALSGSVRARYELLDGQYRPGFDERDDQLPLRTTLRAEWHSGDWRVVGEVYDSRAYDTHAGGVVSANDVNTLEPVQAYVQHDVRDLFGKGSVMVVHAGRFLLNLGSRRLIASDEFRNVPNGYTGVRADIRAGDRGQWNVFYVLPHQRRPDDLESLLDNEWALDHEATDLSLWGLIAAKPALLPYGLAGEVGYVGLREQDNGARATRNRRLHNASVRLARDPAAGRMDLDIEGIYQTGTIRASTAPTAAELDVDAWFLHAEAGYTFAAAWKPHLSLEFDHASGDGRGAKFQRFDTLFGMRRADLAPSGIFAAIGRTNLQSLGVRVEVAPSARLDAFVAWRHLRTAAARDSFSTTGIRDPSGNAGEDAGELLDARMRYWVLPQKLRAEVNLVALLRGPLLREAPNASPWGDTYYATAALTYSF